ncbi:MAG TPA: terminase family protein [Bryobacteraceae bacterium]|nr:terminase family protein [Bryobacteraceae bacterium]
MGGTEIRERGIEYHPLPSQRRFHDSTARFKGFSGPIGSGKSQALCQEALKLAYLNPGRTGLLGAPTFPMLRDATQAALLEILERNRIPHEWNRAENFLVLRETGSRILFRAVEEFERLRGSNLAWFGLDELTYAPQQAWLRLEGRLRDPRASRLCGFAVWTPKGYDWVYERFVEARVEGYETVESRPFENRFLLDKIPDYYERLKHSYDGRFYEQEVLGQYTGVWASVAGSVLTITARTMGLAGNANTVATSTTSGGFTATVSGLNFTAGADGDWRTDLTASPALNRAVRDWSAAYYTALLGYGIDAAASFSMELGNGDPSVSVGIAQRGPAGDPILLPTPSLQTNFSQTSLAYWQVVHEEMAALQGAAGLIPYLQFGEVQWWYFPNDGLGTDFSGMPFYDAWNLAAFAAAYGHAMATITVNTVDPAAYPDEAAYLAATIGNFTTAIMSFVRGTQAGCRFEVLYPTDVNQTAFNRAINFPAQAWTPAVFTCLKTEAFGFTYGRNLDMSWATLDFGDALGFAAGQRSHLLGVGDSTTAWLKEARAAEGKRFESVVLFAIDQFSLIGYEVPLPDGLQRSFRSGG